MKIFQIIDSDTGFSPATLLYAEKEKDFIIELKEELDEWSAPLLFSGLVKKGVFTVPRDISLAWVRERIIPSGRQNISAILANHKLKDYDEMKLLELSGGRCSQDSLYIEKADALPEYVEKRMARNLTGAFTCANGNIICFFADETTRKINLESLEGVEDREKILANPLLFESAKVGFAGYYLTFNDSIDIPTAVLYKSGEKLPLTKGDFVSFVRKNVPDTAEACALLDCSRQNLSYLVKQNQLKPVKEGVSGNLYLKEDLLKFKW